MEPCQLPPELSLLSCILPPLGLSSWTPGVQNCLHLRWLVRCQDAEVPTGLRSPPQCAGAAAAAALLLACICAFHTSSLHLASVLMGLPLPPPGVRPADEPPSAEPAAAACSSRSFCSRSVCCAMHAVQLRTQRPLQQVCSVPDFMQVAKKLLLGAAQAGQHLQHRQMLKKGVMLARQRRV